MAGKEITYINISDKYGEEYEVTVADYRELNPSANITVELDGIYVDGELVAEAHEDTYNLTEIESDFPVTEDEARDIYTEMCKDDDSWDYSMEASGDELRLYAERCDLNVADDFGEEWSNTPSRWEMWVMITDDYGYIIVGEIAS